MTTTLSHLRVQRSFNTIPTDRYMAKEGAAMPGTARHYAEQMVAEFGPGKPTPTLAELLNGAAGARSNFDDGARAGLMKTLKRTGVEATGAAGGFTVPVSMADEIFDAARTVDGPLAFCRFLPSTTLTTWYPCTLEASRALGQTWGGFTASWGESEVILPNPQDGTIARQVFNLKRLLLQTVVSNDLMADSSRIQYWLDGVAKSSIRMQLENAIINGFGPSVGSPNAPLGVIREPSSVQVTRETSATITAKDVSNLWGSMYAGCQRRAAWFCTPGTLNVIDQLATSGQWPEALFLPRGLSPRWPYATIKGAPCIPIETAPELGSVGDLTCVDFSQYAVCYRKMHATDPYLSFSFEANPKNFEGMVGLPPDSVGVTKSDQVLLLQDLSAIVWKMRADFRSLWPGAVVDKANNPIGPAAILN